MREMKDLKDLTKEEKIKIIFEEGKSETFDLSGSDLRGSDLRESDLSWSNLRGAIMDEKTKFSKIKIKKSQVEIILKTMFEVGK